MGKHQLTDLVSVKTLERIQDCFSNATGIACIIRNSNGAEITKVSNQSNLWKIVSSNPQIKKETSETLLSTFDKCIKTGQIVTYQRYLDTWAFVVPIFIDGKAESFFIGGLTRLHNPNIELCLSEAKRLNIDIDKYLEMYLELPLFNQDKLQACANLLKIIATSLSSLAKEGCKAKEKVHEMSELNDFLEKEIINYSLELHETESLYKNLFENINDGVYIQNPDGTFNKINPAGAAILGYKPEEIIGVHPSTLYVNPNERKPLANALKKKGAVEHFYAHLYKKNGEKITVETNATAIHDIHGNVTGYQGIFRKLKDFRQHKAFKTIKHDTASTSIKSNKNNKVSP
ncbi:PAS domain S-box protein [Candidatus Peregrinibacteria bacterium]|nr:PAS domain S-box protein [Candidatus Peregrinibacteria bacterium]